METSEGHDSGGSFTSAAAKQGEKKANGRLTTGSKNIDYLLGGGLELGAITQFYGISGMGKTHLCHLLCVLLAPQFQVVYIDTERTFREEKIKSIAKARRLEWENALTNIQLKTPVYSGQQESDIDQVCSSISNSSDSKVKLLIIDSMTSHYKAEYSERCRLAERSSKLNIYMYKLHRLAITKNIAVVITNHATSDPDDEFRYSFHRPFGGNILSHASNYIINLSGAGKPHGCITAALTKSPIKAPQLLQIFIEDFGFQDAHNRFADEATGEKD
jgi:DNA repair protein RadA